MKLDLATVVLSAAVLLAGVGRIVLEQGSPWLGGAMVGVGAFPLTNGLHSLIDRIIKRLKEDGSDEAEFQTQQDGGAERVKTCGNCKWHEREKFTQGWACVNPGSKKCTKFTMKYDTCSAWEGWTKEEIKKAREQIKNLFGSLKE